MWFQQLLRSNRKVRNSLYGSTLMSHWAFRLLPWIDINNIASFPNESFQHVTMLQNLSIMSCLGLATLVHWIGSLNLHNIKFIFVVNWHHCHKMSSLNTLQTTIVWDNFGLATLSNLIGNLCSLTNTFKFIVVLN